MGLRDLQEYIRALDSMSGAREQAILVAVQKLDRLLGDSPEPQQYLEVKELQGFLTEFTS